MKRTKHLLISVLSLSLIAGFATSCESFDEPGGDVVIPDVEKSFLVSFYNYDDSFLYSTTVNVGKNAVYKGANPTRPNDENFRYNFAGWNRNLNNIQSDLNVYAVYKSERIPTYYVDFVNYDGSELDSSYVKEGENAVYGGQTPTRPDEGNTTYTFIGWNKSLDNINENTTFVAQYVEKDFGYKVKFLNYDDSVLDITSVPYGGTAVYSGNTPVKPASSGESFTFIGWDVDIDYIVEDTIVHACYESCPTVCTVNYKNYDGTLLYTDYVNYGEASTYPNSNPTRPLDGRYEYQFTSWDRNLDKVYNDIDVYALYKKVVRSGTYGINYTFDDATSTCYVSSYSGYSESDIYIPKTYNNGLKTYDVAGISSYAFQNHSEITKVFIEDNVTFIDYFAFAYCSNLREIYLSNKLQTMSYNVFYDCPNLHTISLGPDLVSLDRETIYSSFITEINIDEENPFLLIEDNILYSKDKETLYYALPGFDETNLVIPEGVKTIGYNAFYNKSTLKSVTIPSSVETISDSAFSSCYYLETLTINDARCSIGSSAFYYCSNLRNVSLGDNVTSIGSNAFSECRFTEFEIPVNLTSIGSYAFSSCYNFENFVDNGKNTYFKVINGIVYSNDRSRVVCVPYQWKGTFVVTSNMSSLDNAPSNYNVNEYVCEEGNTTYVSYEKVLYSADYTQIIRVPSSLTSLKIPEGVTAIGQSAFSNNSTLTSVTFPSTLKSIGYQAFYYCSNINSVTFGSGLVTIGDYAFSNCTNITNINLSATSLETIGNYAFEYCSRLSTVNFPNTLTTIGDNAFIQNDIRSLKLGSNLVSIGNSAFYNNDELASVDTSSASSLTTIGNSAFNCCYDLKSFTFPSKLTTIGYSAFASTGLTTLVIPSTIKSIGNDAFAYCSLTSADLSSYTGTLPTNMLYGNDYLKTLTLNSSVTTIPSGFLSNCSSLTSINLPSSVTRIESCAFQNCSLSSISFPTGLTYIGSYALASNKLTSIVIPSKVTTVESYAFYGMPTVRSIKVDSTSITIGDYAFSYYKSNYSTNTIVNSVTFVSGTVNLGNNVFYGTSITNIDFGNATIVCATSSTFYYMLDVELVKVNRNFTYSSGTIETDAVVVEKGLKTDTLEHFTGLSAIYFHGTAKDFASFTNTKNKTATIYYYADKHPGDKNNYWHYNSSGEIEILQAPETTE